MENALPGTQEGEQKKTLLP